jgi:hypothetical protein
MLSVESRQNDVAASLPRRQNNGEGEHDDMPGLSETATHVIPGSVEENVIPERGETPIEYVIPERGENPILFPIIPTL